MGRLVWEMDGSVLYIFRSRHSTAGGKGVENGVVFLPGKLASFHPTQSELIVEKRKEEGFIIYGKLSLFMRRKEEKRANRRFFFLWKKEKRCAQAQNRFPKKILFLKKDIRQTCMQKRAELTSVLKKSEFFFSQTHSRAPPRKRRKKFQPRPRAYFPPVVEVKTKA